MIQKLSLDQIFQKMRISEINYKIIIYLKYYFKFILKKQTMSNQTISRISRNTKKDDLKTCSACTGEQGPHTTHIGISCGQYHYFCNPCFHQILNVQISPQNCDNLPLKCPICKQKYREQRIDMLLTSQQKDHYNLILLKYKKTLDPQTQLYIQCPFCPQGIIIDKNSERLFYFCKNQGCSKMSCRICSRQCTMIQKQQGESQEELQCSDAQYHFICQQLKDMKNAFDKLVTSSLTNACPKCNFKGQKDQNCTHMTCPNCLINWCYICQKIQGEYNQEGNLGHGYEWDNNSKRCPLYLSQFIEVDNQWPEQNEQCVQFYHRQKTLYYLNFFFLKFSKKQIEKFENQFPAIFKGFDREQIQTFKLNKQLHGRIKQPSL